MAFQLFCGWLEFIWLFAPALPRTREWGRATGIGSGRRSRRQSHGACAAAVCGCVDLDPPKAQGSLCDHYHNHIKAAGD